MRVADALCGKSPPPEHGQGNPVCHLLMRVFACTRQGTLFERALEPWLRDQRRALAYVDKIFDASLKHDRDKCLETYEDFMRAGTALVQREYIDHRSVCRCASSCESKFSAADPCS